MGLRRLVRPWLLVLVLVLLLLLSLKIRRWWGHPTLRYESWGFCC